MWYFNIWDTMLEIHKSYELHKVDSNSLFHLNYEETIYSNNYKWIWDTSTIPTWNLTNWAMIIFSLGLLKSKFIKFALIIHKRTTKNDEQHIPIQIVIVTIASGITGTT